MKIVIDYSDSSTEVQNLKIETAKYLSDFAIRIHFNDGSEKLVDFKPFLSKSRHPSIQKYFNENTFSNFSITDGNLNWNDYEMIFPIRDLYVGKIEA